MNVFAMTTTYLNDFCSPDKDINTQNVKGSPTTLVAQLARHPNTYFPPRLVIFWTPLRAVLYISRRDFRYHAFSTRAAKRRLFAFDFPGLTIVCTPLLALSCNHCETDKMQHCGEARHMQEHHFSTVRCFTQKICTNSLLSLNVWQKDAFGYGSPNGTSVDWWPSVVHSARRVHSQSRRIVLSYFKFLHTFPIPDCFASSQKSALGYFFDTATFIWCCQTSHGNSKFGIRHWARHWGRIFFQNHPHPRVSSANYYSR